MLGQAGFSLKDILDVVGYRTHPCAASGPCGLWGMVRGGRWHVRGVMGLGGRHRYRWAGSREASGGQAQAWWGARGRQGQKQIPLYNLCEHTQS